MDGSYPSDVYYSTDVLNTLLHRLVQLHTDTNARTAQTLFPSWRGHACGSTERHAMTRRYTTPTALRNVADHTRATGGCADWFGSRHTDYRRFYARYLNFCRYYQPFYAWRGTATPPIPATTTIF